MLRVLSDACFCLGIVLSGLCGLLFCARYGTFNGLLFFIKGSKGGYLKKPIFDKTGQEANKQKPSPRRRSLFVAGCVLIVLSAAFLVLEKTVGA